MTRPNVEDRSLLLHAALDGELDAAGVIEVERLLAADPVLAEEYARLKALRETIRAKAPRERAPDSLRLRMLELAEIKQAPRREAKTARWRDPRAAPRSARARLRRSPCRRVPATRTARISAA